MPALPNGKAAGEWCPHLTADRRCALFGRPERPQTCLGLQPDPEMCGDSTEDAMHTLVQWERLTAPRPNGAPATAHATAHNGSPSRR